VSKGAPKDGTLNPFWETHLKRGAPFTPQKTLNFKGRKRSQNPESQTQGQDEELCSGQFKTKETYKKVAIEPIRS